MPLKEPVLFIKAPVLIMYLFIPCARVLCVRPILACAGRPARRLVAWLQMRASSYSKGSKGGMKVDGISPEKESLYKGSLILPTCIPPFEGFPLSYLEKWLGFGLRVNVGETPLFPAPTLPNIKTNFRDFVFILGRVWGLPAMNRVDEPDSQTSKQRPLPTQPFRL